MYLYVHTLTYVHIMMHRIPVPGKEPETQERRGNVYVSLAGALALLSAHNGYPLAVSFDNACVLRAFAEQGSIEHCQM